MVDLGIDVDGVVVVSALLLLHLHHPIPAELTIAAGHCPREISPPPSLPSLSGRANKRFMPNPKALNMYAVALNDTKRQTGIYGKK